MGGVALFFFFLVWFLVLSASVHCCVCGNGCARAARGICVLYEQNSRGERRGSFSLAGAFDRVETSIVEMLTFFFPIRAWRAEQGSKSLIPRPKKVAAHSDAQPPAASLPVSTPAKPSGSGPSAATPTTAEAGGPGGSSTKKKPLVRKNPKKAATPTPAAAAAAASPSSTPSPSITRSASRKLTSPRTAVGKKTSDDRPKTGAASSTSTQSQPTNKGKGAIRQGGINSWKNYALCSSRRSPRRCRRAETKAAAAAQSTRKGERAHCCREQGGSGENGAHAS